MQVGQRSLAPSRVFLTFFLLGPAFAAAIQLLLLNVLLLVVFLLSPGPPVRPGDGSLIALLFGAMELSGVAEAILVVLFGFPASFMVAASATASYFVVKRVSVVAVVAAVVAAISFEGILAPGAYFDYLASHSVRGPWVPDEQRTGETMAIFLVCLLHLLPALMCWWLVRDMRKPLLT
jgi:hypothetical protein